MQYKLHQRISAGHGMSWPAFFAPLAQWRHTTWSIPLSHQYNQRYYHRSHSSITRRSEESFRCLHCRLDIICNPIISGVQNRNHCPCCLWSRHLDFRVAGDRLSTCRAAMQPVGLTTKHNRNKYAGDHKGELMIIHQCSRCKKLVINRIAADDSEEDLLALFERSCEPSALFLANLTSAGIVLLTAHDRALVQRRLFGVTVV